MRLHAFPFAIVALALSACGGGGDTPTSTSSHVLTSVFLAAPTQTVVVGHFVQLTASPRDQNNASMTANVVWSSSSNSIATVSSTGFVSAVSAGIATITAIATAGTASVSSATQIVVTSAAPAAVLTSVTIGAPGTTVAAGAVVQLTAVAKDQNGAPMAATLAWTTSDNTLATVSSTGLVQTLAAGGVTVTVNATAGGATVSNAVPLTIVPPQASVLTTLNVAPATATMFPGDNVQLSAAPLDQFGTLMSATMTWSTSNAQLATVSTTGMVTAVSDGSVTITATATAGSVTLTHTVSIAISSFAAAADVTANFSDLFAPAMVEIARGGTVTWTFLTTHNVTFTTDGSPDNVPDTGGGTVSRIFNTAGTFTYTCTLHGGMNGAVIVH